MEKGSIRPMIENLEILFVALNNEYFNGELERPVITISPDSTKGSYGWCSSWRAWQEGEGDGEGYYEVNLCAEHTARGFKALAETLLHELVHLYNLQKGIQDCSRGGTYHNKKFKQMAETKGLMVEQSQNNGWAYTQLTPESNRFLDTVTGIDFVLFRSKVENSSSKKKSSSRKYVCPLCGQSVRATKEIRILCGECSDDTILVAMECEETDDES
jgi:ribosomal protein S27AE